MEHSKYLQIHLLMYSFLRTINAPVFFYDNIRKLNDHFIEIIYFLYVEISEKPVSDQPVSKKPVFSETGFSETGFSK